jgi:hypothetical protein
MILYMSLETQEFAHTEEPSYKHTDNPESSTNIVEDPNKRKERLEWTNPWSWGSRWLSEELVASMQLTENTDRMEAAHFIDRASTSNSEWPPQTMSLEDPKIKAHIGWTEWRSDRANMA